MDIGCGTGSLSKFLIQRGLVGTGADISAQALGECQELLADEIDKGTFTLISSLDDCSEKFALVICINLLEHIPDDRLFLESILSRLEQGGLLIIGVPGREDRWYLEDSIVGHLRRYSKDGLRLLIEGSTETTVEIWSIGFPLMNIGLRIKNIMLRKQANSYSGLSKNEQTLTSGIRSFPFMPEWSILELLSRITMKLFFIPLQRVFTNQLWGSTSCFYKKQGLRGQHLN